MKRTDMTEKKKTLTIGDPAAYLSAAHPGSEIKKLRSACVGESLVPAYIISDTNGCVVNAAACLLVFASGGRNDFDTYLELCKRTAVSGFSRIRNGEIDYYTRLSKESLFLRQCFKAASSPYGAANSLFAKKKAVDEILTGRPVLLNIAFSKQYRDHTVTAFGFDEYSVGDPGRKRLFFRVRDGYSEEDRWLEYRGIIGVFATCITHGV